MARKGQIRRAQRATKNASPGQLAKIRGTVAKVEARNVPRVDKSADEAAETTKDMIKELGKEARLLPPDQLRSRLTQYAADGTLTQQELFAILQQVVGHIENTQKVVVNDVGHLAGKAKEARIVGEECYDDLVAAGLITGGEGMWDDLSRGAIFLNNGRRLDVTSLVVNIAMLKSVKITAKMPGSATLQDRLYSDQPALKLPRRFALEFATRTTAGFGANGASIPAGVQFQCVTKYDPAIHTSILGAGYVAPTSTTTFLQPPEITSVQYPDLVWTPNALVGTVRRKISEIWPTLKAGEVFPINYFVDNTEEFATIAAPVGLVVGARAPELWVESEVEMTNTFDLQSILMVAAALGVTHLINHPLAQASALFTGTVGGALGYAGGVDVSTAAATK